MAYPSPHKPSDKLVSGASNSSVFETRHKTQSQLAHLPGSDFAAGSMSYKNNQKGANGMVQSSLNTNQYQQ